MSFGRNQRRCLTISRGNVSRCGAPAAPARSMCISQPGTDSNSKSKRKTKEMMSESMMMAMPLRASFMRLVMHPPRHSHIHVMKTCPSESGATRSPNACDTLSKVGHRSLACPFWLTPKFSYPIHPSPPPSQPGSHPSLGTTPNTPNTISPSRP